MRKLLSFILPLLIVPLLSGCQVAVNGENAVGLVYEVKPARIVESRINFGESYPVEVFLRVKCEITDSATTLDEITVGKLKDNTLTVKVKTKRSKLAPVSPLLDSFVQDINLGNEYKTGETYIVTVNDTTLSFKGP